MNVLEELMEEARGLSPKELAVTALLRKASLKVGNQSLAFLRETEVIDSHLIE